MPGYRVTIDGDVYEGYYTSMPDAVFGAMRKQINDRYAKADNYPDYRAGRCTKEEWHKASAEHSVWVNSPKLIGAEVVPRFKGRHKAKLVNTEGS